MDLEGFLQKEICLAVKSSIGEDSSDQVVGLRTLIHQEVQSAIHSVLKRSLRKKIEQVIENQLDSAIMRFSAENSEQSAIYSNENNNLTELENAAKFIASAVADLDENVATQVSALSLRSPINPKVNILHDSAILKQPIITTPVSYDSKMKKWSEMSSEWPVCSLNLSDESLDLDDSSIKTFPVDYIKSPVDDEYDIFVHPDHEKELSNSGENSPSRRATFVFEKAISLNTQFECNQSLIVTEPLGQDEIEEKNLKIENSHIKERELPRKELPVSDATRKGSSSGFVKSRKDLRSSVLEANLNLKSRISNETSEPSRELVKSHVEIPEECQTPTSKSNKEKMRFSFEKSSEEVVRGKLHASKGVSSRHRTSSENPDLGRKGSVKAREKLKEDKAERFRRMLNGEISDEKIASKKSSCIRSISQDGAECPSPTAARAKQMMSSERKDDSRGSFSFNLNSSEGSSDEISLASQQKRFRGAEESMLKYSELSGFFRECGTPTNKEQSRKKTFGFDDCDQTEISNSIGRNSNDDGAIEAMQ